MRNFEQLLATPIDTVSLNKRASKFAGRSIKKEAKLCALDQVTRMIDLTTLEGNDTDKRVIRLCQKALVPGGSCPPVAAVCVYPNFVKTAKEALSGTNVKVASVATAFPAGQVAFPIRLEDLKQAVSYLNCLDHPAPLLIHHKLFQKIWIHLHNRYFHQS